MKDLLPKTKYIRNRIILNVLLISIGTMLISTFFINYIYSQRLTKQTAIITEQKMNIIAKSLEEEIEKIIELQNSIQDDNLLQELLRKRVYTEKMGYKKEVDISEMLRQYSYSHIGVSSIFAFDMNREVLDPLYKIEPYNQIVRNFSLFDDFIKSVKNSGFSVPSDFPMRFYKKEEEKSTITYFSNYIDENNFSQIGYLLINIKKDYIFREFIKSCEKEFDFVMILDENGNEIIKVGEMPFEINYISDFINIDSKNKQSIIVEEPDTYLIKQSLDNYSDWTIIGGVSYKVMTEGNRVIHRLIILIGIISIIIAIITSFYISKKITKPIIIISDAMLEFEAGNWPEPIKVDTEDESKILVDGFNKMIVDVKKLIEQVEREQIEKNNFEIYNLQLRLDLLQSQINPHFIHNTLNAIKYLAVKQGAKDIKEMIEAFNLLLRASMSVGKDFITISEELECVKSFIKIFEYRYDHIIEVIEDVELELRDIKIPKLILQPIVENSVYHGILPKGNRGIIKVNINQENSQIKIEITDNGIGMSQDKIESILLNQKKLYGKGKKGFNNIGLENINNRLKLYYGENSELKIESEENIGTKVFFTIPKEYTEG